jgi:hypothetical protein
MSAGVYKAVAHEQCTVHRLRASSVTPPPGVHSARHRRHRCRVAAAAGGAARLRWRWRGDALAAGGRAAAACAAGAGGAGDGARPAEVPHPEPVRAEGLLLGRQGEGTGWKLQEVETSCRDCHSLLCHLLLGSGANCLKHSVCVHSVSGIVSGACAPQRMQVGLLTGIHHMNPEIQLSHP